MSSYRKLILTTALLSITSIGCANSNNALEKKLADYNFELNYMMATDGEFSNNPQQALKYYIKLYQSMPTHELLFKIVSISYKDNDFDSMYKYAQLGSKQYPKQIKYYKQQIIIALMAQKKYHEALNSALELLKEDKKSFHYEIVANIYYLMKDYKNASKYYESAYLENKNEETLIKLVSILDSYLNQKEMALAYLETHVQQTGCNSPAICEKLLLTYQEQNNIDGMISILTKMYNKYKQNPSYAKASKIIETHLVMLLEKKDIKEAISFLEKNETDTTKLLNLYYQNNQFDDALKLVRSLYKKTKDPELLGKIAMYQFEGAKDKKKILKHVIANFELALSSGINNPSYQNYYGYLLIDYDIDIKKGITLVKTALKSMPNNLAYLDSLAWGYYKLGDCNKAYITMSQIVQLAGLSDPEIKNHWEIIQKCTKEK